MAHADNHVGMPDRADRVRQDTGDRCHQAGVELHRAQPHERDRRAAIGTRHPLRRPPRPRSSAGRSKSRRRLRRDSRRRRSRNRRRYQAVRGAAPLRQRFHHRTPCPAARGPPARHHLHRRRTGAAVPEHAALQQRIRPGILARGMGRQVVCGRAAEPATDHRAASAGRSRRRIPARQDVPVIRGRRRWDLCEIPLRLAEGAALREAGRQRRGDRAGGRQRASPG